MKYSSCLWPSEESSLGDAEDTILASYCKEAKLGKGLRGVGEGEVEAGKEGEGLRILDLGCGWGSLGLFLAEVRKPVRAVRLFSLSQEGDGLERVIRSRADIQHYPLAEITMLSNSKTQKLHIDATAAEKGFKNVTVITGDVNVYDFEEKGKYVIPSSISE